MKENDLLILENLLQKPRTANEVIESIRRNDHEEGVYRMKIHFYTHLNKRFDPLKKAGLLMHVSYKKGPSNRDEKTWSLTKLAESRLQELSESDLVAKGQIAA